MGSIAGANSQVPTLLQRCLADAACRDALATAAAAGKAAPLQQQPPLASDGAATAWRSTAAPEDAQPHQRSQPEQLSGDANVASSGDRGFLNSGGEGSSLGHAEAVAGAFRDGSFGDDISVMWVDNGDVGGGMGDSHGSSSGFGGGINENEEDPTSLSLKAVAALVLFVEAVAGMYLPLLLQRLQSPQWWLSLLNCFSGGIFLAAGIIHLLPHCAEAQEALGPIGPNGDYPLYLVLVVVGYCGVFYVERVLFDVHGEGHAHCQHSNVFSHSSYYKAISHRWQRAANRVAAGAAASAPATLMWDLAAAADIVATRARADREAAVPGLAALLPPHQHQHPACGPSRAQLDGGSGDGYEGCTHHHQHDHHHARKPEGDVEGRAPGGSVEARPMPLTGSHGHSHGHQHSHLHAGHGHQQVSSGSSPLGRRLLPGSTEGLCRAAGVGFVLQTGVAVPVAACDGDDEDAESCHSEHPPRAVCACVEERVAETEAEAARDRRRAGSSEGSGLRHHKHGLGHHHGHQHAHHDYLPQHKQPQQNGHGRGEAGGCSSDDQLRAPLLSCRAESEVAPAPPPPPTALGDVGAADDSDALASLHLQPQQHQPQQLPALPLHPPNSCAYHTHHHPHPHPLHHRRYQRRSATGCSTSGDGAAAAAAASPLADSRASSCTSLAQHLDHRHTHHSHHRADHDHDHHHHHTHVIKPRFRFMHGVVLLVALALHTSLECIALGLIDSRPQFLLLFAAIASHKAVSALALSSRFLREGATLGQVTAYVGPFCLVAPASILAGVYVGRVAPLARLVFSCFATGTFLYVGASEVIMEEFEGEMRADRRDISTRAARYIKFSAVLAAVALVAASGLLPDPDHH